MKILVEYLQKDNTKFIFSMAALGILFGVIEGLAKWIRMLLGVPDPMSAEILWVAPVFYGALALVFGVLTGFFVRFFAQVLTLKRETLDVLQFGILVMVATVGSFNTIGLFISTASFAKMILALGLAYQGIHLLRSRLGGTTQFLARVFPWLAGATVCLALIVPFAKFVRERVILSNLPASKKGAPNVLLITVDTLRADHLSAYGYSRPTPNLDQFAKEGLQFDYAFATAPWTLPSHAGLMTGLLTNEHRAETMTGGRLEGKFHTLAEAFTDNGYETAAFIANLYVCTANLGFGQGFSHYDDLAWSMESLLRLTTLGERISYSLRTSERFHWHQMGRKSAEEVNREFLSWLNASHDKPYFVWLNYFDAHDPYTVPSSFKSPYGAKPADGNPGSFGVLGSSDWFGKLSDQETQMQMDAYDSTIAYIDAQLGVLFSTLSQKSLYDNTIIIITSDHGEAFGEHGLYGHGNSLYGEVLHVPLMIRYPKGIQPGTRVQQQVSLKDVPSTVSEMAGLELKTGFPGAILNDGIKNQQVISELFYNPYHPSSQPESQGNLTSVITDDWHAIFLGKKTELYSREDQKEQTDLGNTAAGRVVLDQLKKETSILSLVNLIPHER